jgi:hypothetical protein
MQIHLSMVHRKSLQCKIEMKTIKIGNNGQYVVKGLTYVAKFLEYHPSDSAVIFSNSRWQSQHFQDHLEQKLNNWLIDWFHRINTIILLCCEIATKIENKQIDPNKCKGSTKRTLCGIILFKLNTFYSHVFVCPYYWFYVFFAYIGFIGDQFFLLSTDSTYLRVPEDKGESFFFRLRIFFGAHFTYKLVYYNLYHLSNFMQNRLIFTRNRMYQICM